MQKEFAVGVLTAHLKPKYKVLNMLLGESFNAPNGIDVFLDFNSFIKAMTTSKKFLQSLPFSENVEKSIVSTILFTIKHWKDYVRKYENSRIFVILNDFKMEGVYESSQIKSYLYPYVNKMESDKFKQLTYYFEESIKRVETIVKYIPNVYVMRCDRFDSYIIPNIIDDYSTNDKLRLIVSNNSLMTNYLYMPNCKVIYGTWSKYGIAHLSDPLMIVQKITSIDDDIVNIFTKNKIFYNLLNMIIGDYDRGILGITKLGITPFATDIIRNVEQRKIPEDPKSIDTILPIIEEEYHPYLKQVYSVCDIEKHSELIPKSYITKYKSEKMIDLLDIDGLRNISIDGLNLLELL